MLVPIVPGQRVGGLGHGTLFSEVFPCSGARRAGGRMQLHIAVAHFRIEQIDRENNDHKGQEQGQQGEHIDDHGQPIVSVPVQIGAPLTFLTGQLIEKYHVEKYDDHEQ